MTRAGERKSGGAWKGMVGHMIPWWQQDWQVGPNVTETENGARDNHHENFSLVKEKRKFEFFFVI